MGGRGASYGAVIRRQSPPVASGSALDAFKNAGVRFGTAEDDPAQLNQKALNESLKGVKDVLEDMGLPLTTVTAIEAHNGGIGKGGSTAMAAANGFRQLTFMKRSYDTYQPQKDNGYTIGGNDYYATGVHEAGHIVARYLTEQKFKGESILTVANKWRSHTIEKEIIRNTQKTFKGKKVISKYAGTGYSDAVAEAFADVHYNGANASDYSKAIVQTTKDLLKKYG